MLLVLFLLISSSLGDLISVNPESRRLHDEDGRERIFHGVNVVYKGPPYYPETTGFDGTSTFSEKDAQILHELGLNAVRLGVMWPGTEPVRNEYNETYLTVMKGIMKTLNKYNIYAYLDCHQDVLSEKFCGEGVPAWAAIPNQSNFPEPFQAPYPVSNSTGFPSTNDCKKWFWADYYETEAVSSAFQSLYDNTDGLQDSFAGYWKKLAQEFKSFPNLLGYELFNEPWAGDIYRDPLLLVPGVADVKNLQPMYDRLNSAIRSIDDEHLIFFEPVTWDDVGVGFEHVPGGDDYRNRSVLSYHFYIPPQFNLYESFVARLFDLERLKCGGFLTEFNVGPGSSDSITATAEVADYFFQSWTGWEYKSYFRITGWSFGLFYPNGTLDSSVVSAVSRTYATAIAGVGELMSFEPSTGIFNLQYRVNPDSKLPTEIYLNEDIHYPNGFEVGIAPIGAANWVKVTKNRLHIVHTTVERELLVIEIKPTSK